MSRNVNVKSNIIMLLQDKNKTYLSLYLLSFPNFTKLLSGMILCVLNGSLMTYKENQAWYHRIKKTFPKKAVQNESRVTFIFNYACAGIL